jgi:microcystin synthetase protein McyG
LRETLGNIQKLLASDGMLLFLEAEAAYFWVDMVFGLTEGWWRFRDVDLRPEHPLLTRHAWKALLQEVGFRDVESLSLTSDDKLSDQVVMLARGPHIETQGPEIAAVTGAQGPDREPGSWLLFADQSGVAEQLVQQLTSAGETCVRVRPGRRFHAVDAEHFEIDPHNPADMALLMQVMVASHPDWRGTLHLWSLDTPPPAETSIRSLQHAEALGCHCVVHYIQALAGTERLPTLLPQLILVTRGAQPAGESAHPLAVSQVPLIGLGRVIQG